MPKTLIFLLVLLGLLLNVGCGNKKPEQRDISIKDPLEKYKKISDAEFNQPDSTGKTLLHHASMKNDTNLIAYLLERGLFIDAKDNKGSLHQAVKNQNIASARFLLKHNADIHSRTKKQDTPLHLAVYNNDIATVELLYFKGAHSDALKQNAEGYFPLAYAVRKRYYSMAELLYWPLHYIIKRNKQEYFDHLLQIDPEYVEINKR